MSSHRLFGRSSLKNHRSNEWFEICQGKQSDQQPNLRNRLKLNVNPGFSGASYFARTDEMEVAILGSPYGIGKLGGTDLVASGQLVETLNQRGVDTLSSLGGRFAIAVYFLERDEFLLAVDRAATENIYFIVDENDICFANDTKSLAFHPLVEHRFSLQAIYDYFFFHCLPGSDCGYINVRRLPPGHYINIRDNVVTLKEYWQPKYSPENSVPAHDDLRDALANAVEKRIPDGPVACFLSGGLDSSTVTGYCHESKKDQALAVTIGFDEEAYNETEFAAAVATHYGIKHESYNVTPEDILESISQICTSFNTPFGNASAIPTYFCAKLAKSHGYSKMLAGDGGDELFGGNTRYAKELILEGYQHIPRFIRSRLLEPVISTTQNFIPNPVTRKLRNYIARASIPMPARTQAYNLLNRVDSTDFLSGEFLQAVDRRSPLQHLETSYFKTPVPEDLINRMLRLDWHLTLADNDLIKVTRMCDIVGCDVQFPMLDETVFDLAARLPIRDKVTKNELRPFFRDTFSPMLPASTISKSKHGFGLPFGIWLSRDDPLKELAFSALEYLTEQRILDRKKSADFFNKKLSENADYYGVLLWVLMCFAFWAEGQGTLNFYTHN